jgi:hypothetical protein
MLIGVKNFKTEIGDEQQRYDRVRRNACHLALLAGFIA